MKLRTRKKKGRKKGRKEESGDGMKLERERERGGGFQLLPKHHDWLCGDDHVLVMKQSAMCA